MGYFTEEEAEGIAEQVRGKLTHAGQTMILPSLCVRCGGSVRFTMDPGHLGKKKSILDIHCEECGTRLDIEWP